MKWETVSQSQFLMLFEARAIIIQLAVSEETKHKYVSEPCLNLPKGWINPTAIYPEKYLIFIVVNCNELILLGQKYETAVDPRSKMSFLFQLYLSFLLCKMLLDIKLLSWISVVSLFHLVSSAQVMEKCIRFLIILTREYSVHWSVQAIVSNSVSFVLGH